MHYILYCRFLEGDNMKALITNKASVHFDKLIDVKLLKYRYVYGFLSDTYTKVKVPYEDADFKFDHEWEESIVRHRELLNISLPAASMKFYAVLCYAVEQHFGGRVDSICVIKDINEKVRSNYWYKNIEPVVNGSCPVNIRIWGRNFSDTYDINIEDMNVEKFTEECREGIDRLNALIQKSNEKIVTYRKAMKAMGASDSGGNPLKAIGER
jgi:hypothetical protein